MQLINAFCPSQSTSKPISRELSSVLRAAASASPARKKFSMPSRKEVRNANTCWFAVQNRLACYKPENLFGIAGSGLRSPGDD